MNNETAVDTARQRDRATTLKQARLVYDESAISYLAKTEFPEARLGRKQAKAARAFRVLCSSRKVVAQ